MYTTTLLEFLNMGGGEIMLILAVVLLLFGGKKMPELARGLGKGIRDFKDASEGVKREIHRNINAVTMEEDLRKEDLAETGTTVEKSESQLYSEAEVKAPINLDKTTALAENTDIAATAEKIETEKK